MYFVYSLAHSIMNRRSNKDTVTQQAAAAQEPPDSEPRELPVDKWSGTLQSLLLQNNNIRFLPNYLGGFTALARLDISKYGLINSLFIFFTLICTAYLLFPQQHFYPLSTAEFWSTQELLGADHEWSGYHKCAEASPTWSACLCPIIFSSPLFTFILNYLYQE